MEALTLWDKFKDSNSTLDRYLFWKFIDRFSTKTEQHKRTWIFNINNVLHPYILLTENE